MPLADEIARYAIGLSFDDLSDHAVHTVKLRLIDSLGCGLGAYDAPPAAHGRAYAATVPVGPSTVLGTRARTTPDVAAFVNGTMVRYFDFNDGYIGDEPGHEPGHPSDNIAACLAVAEAERRSGKDLITAIVLAYEVQMRFQDAANLYRQGWDHVNYVLIACTVAAAKLMGLTQGQTVEAVNIAVNGHIALRQVRTGRLSAWKASSAPNAARNGIVAAQLARAGFTGPSPIFEGRAGFAAQITGELVVDPRSFAARPTDRYRISRSLTKLLPTNGEMQSAVWAAIAVRAAIGDPARIESVQVATTHIGHFILANDAEKWRPTTRETADHSLPYTVARALLDGALTVRSYAPAAITAPEVRALMDKVTVVEDPELTAMTPTFLPNRVTVRTRDGAEFSEQVADAAGGARKAMTDQQFEDKFRTLLEDLASEEQATRILDLVRSLDEAAHVDELLAAAVLERAARHQRADDGRGVTSPVLDPQVAALLSPVAERSPRPPGPPVREVRDLGLPLRGRTLPARLYGGDLDDCLVVFFHGGGFVTGDLDSHDAQARDLCRTTGRPVLSVAYRLAPDHPFPAAYDDAVAAVSWAGAHLAGRVAVAGPSAGANLALGAALALAGSPAAPVAQLLAYPLVSGDPSYPSRTEMGEGCGLTSEAIEWCLGRYLTDPAQRHDPRAAPLLSPDLASAPPAVVVGAGLDPLRDEARALAERLRIAEVRVRYVEEPTLPHGFWKFAPLADAARAAAGRMGGAFRVLLDAAGRTHRAGGSGTSCTDP